SAAVPSRSPSTGDASSAVANFNGGAVFCHTFDLAKRLTLTPEYHRVNFIPIPPPQPLRTSNPSESPFGSVLALVKQQLTTSTSGTIHRLIIPTVLSPLIYPPDACSASHILPFLHSLRALLRQHPSRLSILMTLPLALYPRSSSLVRWMEYLCDGAISLHPFPHRVGEIERPTSEKGKAEEKPQGMLNVHKLPIFAERGGGAGRGVGEGGAAGGEDLCFIVSRRKFLIKPYNLPPMEGGEEDKGKDSMDF
ncbi:hypothetical protein LTS18_010154, partial [Coniosporium uncinatum]